MQGIVKKPPDPDLLLLFVERFCSAPKNHDQTGAIWRVVWATHVYGVYGVYGQHGTVSRNAGTRRNFQSRAADYRHHVPSPARVPSGSLQHVIPRFVNRECRLSRDGARADYLDRMARALRQADWTPLTYAAMSSDVHHAGTYPPAGTLTPH